MERSDLYLFFFVVYLRMPKNFADFFLTGSKQIAWVFCHFKFFCWFPVGKSVNIPVIPDTLLKLRCTPNLSIIWCTSAILFCWQMSSILHDHSKYIFLIDHNYKTLMTLACQKLLTMSGSFDVPGRCWSIHKHIPSRVPSVKIKSGVCNQLHQRGKILSLSLNFTVTKFHLSISFFVKKGKVSFFFYKASSTFFWWLESEIYTILLPGWPWRPRHLK